MGARIPGAALVLSLLSTPASAQTALPSASLQMGLPSAPLQTTLPSASLPPPAAPVTSVPAPPSEPFRAGPQTYAPRYDRRVDPDPRFVGCCTGFVGQAFVPWTSQSEARSSERRAPQRHRAGYVRLRVHPGVVQVYVDGFYVGSVDELRGLVPLEEGPHRVELRAAGYETVTFDVRVVASETVTYNADLEPSRSAQKPVAVVPAVSKTFYVIPHCYAGDRPPTEITLPPSCDIANVRTIPPMVHAVRPVPPARN